MKDNPALTSNCGKELTSLGAREFQIVALSADADRGLAALRDGSRRGAEIPFGYAIKIFDNATGTRRGRPAARDEPARRSRVRSLRG